MWIILIPPSYSSSRQWDAKFTGWILRTGNRTGGSAIVLVLIYTEHYFWHAVWWLNFKDGYSGCWSGVNPNPSQMLIVVGEYTYWTWITGLIMFTIISQHTPAAYSDYFRRLHIGCHHMPAQWLCHWLHLYFQKPSRWTVSAGDMIFHYYYC